ncbi:MAG: DUF6476 family protein [Aliishimia sp.]
MDDLPLPDPVEEPRSLRFLRRLVTVLTITMILGMITVVAVLVLRFNQSAPDQVTFPKEIALPDGVIATAFTKGTGWYAVVTSNDSILIYDAKSGELRQTIEVKTQD